MIAILSIVIAIPFLLLYSRGLDLTASRTYGSPYPELQITRPSIYSSQELVNISVTPLTSYYRNLYFADTGDEFPEVDEEVRSGRMLRYTYVAFAIWVNAVRGMAIFRPRKVGYFVLLFLATAATIINCYCVEVMTNAYYREGNADDEMMAAYSNYRIPMLLLTFFSLFVPYSVCYKLSSRKRAEKHCSSLKLGAVMLLYAVMEFVVFTSYQNYLLETYFRSSTSFVVKVCIRMLGSVVFLTLLIEMAVRISNFLQNECGAELRDTFVVLVPGICLITFLARVMQGSTTTVGEMIVLEVAGTIAEFSTADGLLKGMTPFDNIKSFFGFKTVAEKFVSDTKNLNKVTPGDADATEEGEKQSPEEQSVQSNIRLETNCQVFCAGVLIMLSIGEATAIVSSSLFFLLLKNINPAEPGSEPLSNSTVVSLMRSGELQGK
jgi:hypothetical protein